MKGVTASSEAPTVSLVGEEKAPQQGKEAQMENSIYTRGRLWVDHSPPKVLKQWGQIVYY